MVFASFMIHFLTSEVLYFYFAINKALIGFVHFVVNGTDCNPEKVKQLILLQTAPKFLGTPTNNVGTKGMNIEIGVLYSK